MQGAWFSLLLFFDSLFYIPNFLRNSSLSMERLSRVSLDFNPGSATGTVTYGKMETPMATLQTSWTVTWEDTKERQMHAAALPFLLFSSFPSICLHTALPQPLFTHLTFSSLTSSFKWPGHYWVAVA